MSDKVRFALVLLAAWGFVISIVAAAVLRVPPDLADSQRAFLAMVLRERIASIVVAAFLLLFPLALLVHALWGRYVTAPRKLAENVRIMTKANPSHRASARGSAETRALAAALNGFADAHKALKQDVDR